MMLMRILIVALLITPSLLAQEPPPGFSDRVVLVESEDAPGEVDQGGVARLFWRMILEQKLQFKRIPRVLVLHLSGTAAGKLGRAATKVRTDHCERISGETYYQLWLVGEPTLQEYFVGLQAVLQREFDLKLTEGELKDLLARVVPQESGRVDVRDLVGHTGQ